MTTQHNEYLELSNKYRRSKLAFDIAMGAIIFAGWLAFIVIFNDPLVEVVRMILDSFGDPGPVFELIIRSMAPLSLLALAFGIFRIIQKLGPKKSPRLKALEQGEF